MSSILSTSVLINAVVGTLTSMCADKGVNSTLNSIAESKLSLGVLDPDFDIPRAARICQINSAIIILTRARDNETKEIINGGAYVPQEVSIPYEKAIEKFRRLARNIEKSDLKEIFDELGDGYSAIDEAIQHLLKSKLRQNTGPNNTKLTSITRDEAVLYGGWASSPNVLSEAFEFFPEVFAASVGSLLKSPHHEGFFRSWRILQAQATNANISRVFDAISKHEISIHQKSIIAKQIAGGQDKLSEFETSIGHIYNIVNEIERKIDLHFSKFEETDTALEAQKLLKREIEIIKKERHLSERQITAFFKTILQKNIDPDEFGQAFDIVANSYFKLLSELARKTNSPAEVLREKAAAKSALEEERYDDVKHHLNSIANASRIELSNSSNEYAEALVGLANLAITQLNHSEAYEHFKEIVELPGINQDQFITYSEQFLSLSHRMILRDSGSGREFLNHLLSSKVKPVLATYNCLLNKASSFSEAQIILDEMRSSNILPDIISYKQLVQKAPDLTTALSIKDKMEDEAIDPDHGFYLTLIQKAPNYSKALEIIDRSKNSGVILDISIYNSLIMKAANFSKALTILEGMKRDGVSPNIVTYNNLLRLCGNLSSAQTLFQEIKTNNLEPSVFTFNCLIKLAHNYKKALSIVRQLKNSGLQPNGVTYTLLIKKAPNPAKARDIFNEMIDAGITESVHSYASLIKSVPNFSEAQRIFSEMKANGIEPNFIIYSSLITSSSDFHEACEIFEQTDTENRLKFNHTVYDTLMKLAPNYPEAKYIYDKMLQSGVKPTRNTYVALISLVHDFSEAFLLYTKMVKDRKRPGETESQALLKLTAEPVRALELYNEMHSNNTKPVWATYYAICHITSDYLLAQNLLNKMIKGRYNPDRSVFSKVLFLASDFLSAQSTLTKMIKSNHRPEYSEFSKVFFLAPDYTSAKRIFKMMMQAQLQPKPEMFARLKKLKRLQ